jgi:hypothetical protein
LCHTLYRIGEFGLGSSEQSPERAIKGKIGLMSPFVSEVLEFEEKCLQESAFEFQGI